MRMNFMNICLTLIKHGIPGTLYEEQTEKFARPAILELGCESTLTACHRKQLLTATLNRGHATLNNKNGQFVVDTGTGGFNLHETEDCAFVRNFATGTPIKRHPKQVKFGEKGQVVIGGSDHGIVYVFDRMTGNKLAELKAAEQGMVQTVTVSLRIIPAIV